MNNILLSPWRGSPEDGLAAGWDPNIESEFLGPWCIAVTMR